MLQETLILNWAGKEAKGLPRWRQSPAWTLQAVKQLHEEAGVAGSQGREMDPPSACITFKWLLCGLFLSLYTIVCILYTLGSYM